MKKSQLDFFKNNSQFGYGRAEYGGCDEKLRDRRIGKRKVQRPFDRKKSLHLTMRADCAKGKLSMLSPKNQIAIKKLVDREIKRANAKLHKFGNVGNHLHMVAHFPSRASFQRFLRIVSAMIARLVTGARKGKPFGKFWDALAHTRVITGRRAFQVALRYVEANQMEAAFGKVGREAFELGLIGLDFRWDGSLRPWPCS